MHTSVLEQRKPQSVHGLSLYTCTFMVISWKVNFLKTDLQKKSMKQRTYLNVPWFS